MQSYIQEERVKAHLTNWIGIDDHADKLTIALYVGSQKQPTKEWEVAPTESGLRQLVRWLKELKGHVHCVRSGSGWRGGKDVGWSPRSPER